MLFGFSKRPFYSYRSNVHCQLGTEKQAQRNTAGGLVERGGMFWGTSARQEGYWWADPDVSMSSDGEENIWTRSSKYGTAQSRDRRDPRRSFEGMAPWFGGLFTHKGRPRKKCAKKTRRPKSRGWSCCPRSSQEWGLVGVLDWACPFDVC